MSNKTVADLRSITGLSEENAKYCFQTFGWYGAALASFVQSYETIPKDYFENTESARKNVEAINKEMKSFYATVRELKKKYPGKTDLELWKEAGSPLHKTGEEKKSTLFQFNNSASSMSFTEKPSFESSNAATSAANAFSTKDSKASSFGFGIAPVTTAETKTSTGTSSQPINFGFGTAPVTTTTATGEKKSSDAAAKFEMKFVSEGSVAVQADKEKKLPTYCEPSHDTRPFFEIPEFWDAEVEGGASLFNLDGGFLARNKDNLRPMLLKWVDKARFYLKPVKYVVMDDPDEETVRVIIKDADRSFLLPQHRSKLVSFLHAMQVEFGAYGQAMSYLAGLCMLVLTEEETAAVIRFVSSEYIPGHWAAEAVGFSTSAWVVEYFMKELYRDVALHLEKLRFWPDTYLQKILTGLCIHVLSFNELFEFLNAFMEGGQKYLICFCLAVVEHFRSNLLGIQSAVEASTLYETMSLNSRVCHVSDVRAILKRAPLINLGEDGEKISLIRSAVYEKHVGPRISLAPKVPTFEPCELCQKERPSWFSDDVGAVCTNCKAKHPEYAYESY